MVPVLIRLIAERAAGFDQTIEGTQAAFQELETLGGSVARSFGAASVALGGIAASIIGIGGAVLSTASEFEQLQARLRAVISDVDEAAAAFDRAVEFAGQTPFDVQSIVRATVTLQTFGVSAQDNLARVASLGAAFGDLQGATLAFSKAAAGSLEGFESLRSTFGISTSALARYGAEVSKTGGVLVQTQAQIDKAREALQQIIDVRFGTAIEQQAATFQGALSNLGDSVTRAAAAFGEVLIPAATATARALQGVVGFFADLPIGVRQGVVAVGAIGAGLAAFGAAATGAIAVVGALVAGIGAVGAALSSGTVVTGLAALPVAFAAISGSVGTVVTTLGILASSTPAAAAGLLGLGSVTGAVSTAFTGLAATAATAGAATVTALGPVGIALAAIAVAAGAIGTAFGLAAAESEEISAALDKSSRSAQSAATQFRTLSDDLERTLGIQTDFGRSSGSVQNNVEALGAALASRSPQELSDAFRVLGRSARDLEADLGTAEGQLQSTRDRLRELRDIIDRLELGRELTSEQTRVFELLGNDANNLKTEIQQVNIEFVRLSTVSQQLRSLIGVFSPISANLEAASAEATKLDTFLKFAGRETDIGRLNQAVALTEQQLEAARAKFAEFSGEQNTSTQALIDRLQQGDQLLAEERQAIEDILSLEQSRDQIQGRIRSQQQAAEREATQAILNRVRQETASLTRSQADNSQRIQIIREAITETEAGTDTRAQLERQLTQAIQAEERSRTEATKTSLSNRTQAISDSIIAAENAAGATGASIEAAVRGGIASLEAFRQANQAAFGDPQVVRAYQQALQGLNDDLERTTEIQAAERFEEVRRRLKELIESATAGPERLRAIQNAINTLDVESRLATTAQQRQRIEQEIDRFKQQELQTTQQIQAAEERLAGEISQLRVQAIQQEIQLLEARQAAGEGVDNALLLKREELKQARFTALEEEAAKAIEEGDNQELVAERLRLKKEAINRAETISKTRELSRQTQATRDAADQQVAIEEQRISRVEDLSNRLGGAASPLIGLEDLTVGSSLPSTAQGFGERFFQNATAPVVGARAAQAGSAQAGSGAVAQGFQGIVGELRRLVQEQGPGPLTEAQLDQRLGVFDQNLQQGFQQTFGSGFQSGLTRAPATPDTRPPSERRADGGAPTRPGDGQTGDQAQASRIENITVNVDGAGSSDVDVVSLSRQLVKTIKEKIRQEGLTRGPASPEGI